MNRKSTLQSILQTAEVPGVPISTHACPNLAWNLSVAKASANSASCRNEGQEPGMPWQPQSPRTEHKRLEAVRACPSEACWTRTCASSDTAASSTRHTSLFKHGTCADICLRSSHMQCTLHNRRLAKVLAQAKCSGTLPCLQRPPAATALSKS